LTLIPLLAVLLLPSRGAGDDDWQALFNGRDLSGWIPLNVAPGTFSARDGMIVSTGKPTGVLRSEKQYENFVLELEWRHMQPQGNAGLFVWSHAMTAPGTPFCRAIEVQVLDGLNSDTYTSHGDVFAIHGAVMTPDRPHPRGAMRCLPSESRCKPSPEWNHYRVECNNGVIRLAVNGKVVSGGTMCNPRKGYLCIESEGSEAHYRNLRIRELPSSDPAPDNVAPAAQPWRNLYNGVDLANWQSDPNDRRHWRVKDWILEGDGSDDPFAMRLPTKDKFRNFELICDWRLTQPPVKRAMRSIHTDGAEGPEVTIEDAGQAAIRLRGDSLADVALWSRNCGSGALDNLRAKSKDDKAVRAASVPRIRADHPAGQWNRLQITLRGEIISVRLNEQLVIDQARIPGVAESGPIELIKLGAPVQFANLLLLELP
jgi:hypothetical protein